MKFKRILASLLAVTVVGANMSAALVDFPKIFITANAEGTESSLKYEILEDGTIEITGCDKSVTTVEIPAEIDGKKVTGIGYFAFLGCSKLTSVTIPDSVTNISNYAFSGCSALMSIAIPNSVTSIGSYVFSGTAWLENKQKENPLVIVNGILIDGTTCSGDAVIPDGVTSIVYNAFQGCSGLTSITIPNSVTSIGSGAFLDCSGLTLITILNPDCKIYNSSSTICNNNDEAYFGVIKGYSGSTAEKYAEKYERKFESLGEAPAPESSLKYEILEDGTIEITGCDKSVTTVEIPAEIDGKKVTSIGGSAFDGCNGLTSITIPDSVTSIGEGAFYSTPWLENKQKENPLVIVNGILIDGTTCSDDVVIPNNVTSIGYGAFGYCYELTSITIPDSVTSIGVAAFWGCSGLTEITIPDSVTNIGGSAFLLTPWLKEKQKENPLVIVNGVLIDGTTCSGDVVIPDSVKSIGNEAFDGCLGLTSITISDNVTSIDYRAFGGCWGLTSITILNPNCEIYDDPNTISNDYDNGFNGTIYGYENSTAQAYAEKYNKKFESLGDAPAPETSLEYEVLDDGTIEITGCDKSVTTVEIPAEIDGKKVTSIGDNAFSNCSELTSVTISDGVMSIGNVAFSNCSTLTSITIPDSVTSIGVMAFNGTPWLENKQKDDTLVIVNGILIDGTTCSGDVIILDSVASIGYWAFRDCSDMTSVTIPNSVTSIDDAAFNNCSQLTSITILNPDCEISDYEATISNDNDNSFVGTIYGYENSTAQAYAEKFNRKFESLGEAPATELAMGDVNGDNTIDSSDASVVLVDYSLTSTGKKSTLTDAQKAAADIDKDGKIDSSDASFILSYYSYISTGGTETDMSKWFGK